MDEQITNTVLSGFRGNVAVKLSGRSVLRPELFCQQCDFIFTIFRRRLKQVNETLASIVARIPQTQEKVWVMSWDRTGYTAGSETLFDDVIRACGGVRVS